MYAAAVAVIAILLFLPLFGREGFSSHEGANPYYRVLMYQWAIADGHWLPQSFPLLFRGAGYAFPRFYPPLGNLVALGLTAMTGDVVAGVHLSYLLSVVLSALAMYLLLLHLTASRPIALLGAFAYVTFPYRFEDVFVRGALAECWSFVWYPLIVLGGLRVLQGRRAPWHLPVAFGGLVLSHPQMGLYFLSLCALLLLTYRPRPTARQFGAIATTALLGLGISAWFWLPQQYYLPTIWASVPRTVWADVPRVEREHVHLLQAFVGMPKRMGMSLSVGLVGILANLLAAYLVVRRPSTAARQESARRGRWLLIPWWLLLVFLVEPGVFLTILPKAFGYIQFPWRVLGLMGFFSAASLATSLAATHRAWLTAVTAGALILATLQAGLVPHTRPEWTATAMEQRLLTRPVRRGLTGASEYLPRSVRGLAGPYERALQAWGRRIVGAPYVSPGLTVRSFITQGSTRELTVESRGSGTVVLPVTYYDFYVATSANWVRLTPADSSGLLALSVPGGRHVIRITEVLTPVYHIALLISLLSLTLLAWREARVAGVNDG
jgi:hypothetical protein